MTDKNTVERLIYRNGELLDANDLTHEQQYHINQRQQQTRALFTPGVLSGLGVSFNETHISLSSGLAIDSKGRQIALVSKGQFGNTQIEADEHGVFSIPLNDLTEENSRIYIEYGYEQSSGDNRQTSCPKIILLGAEKKAPEEAVSLSRDDRFAQLKTEFFPHQTEPKAGSNILFSDGKPAKELGKEDDSCFDKINNDLYLKTSAGWQLQGNLKGQAGAQGDTGAHGEKGEKGEQGPAGHCGVSDSGLFRRVDNEHLETPIIGIEYYSPQQHGGLYGNIYRIYIGSNYSNSSLITTSPRGELIDSNLLVKQLGCQTVVKNASYSDNSNEARFQLLDNGELRLKISSAYELKGGWVDFTRVELPDSAGKLALHNLISQSKIKISAVKQLESFEQLCKGVTLASGSAQAYLTQKQYVDAGYPLEIVLNTLGVRALMRLVPPLMSGSEHRPHLEPYYVGKFQISQIEWQRVTGSTPSEFKLDDNPVNKVTRQECVDFAAKLNSDLVGTGWEVSLPSVEEWIHACRAGTTTQYYSGSLPLNKQGKELSGMSPAQAHSNDMLRVGTIAPPNAYGLYDLYSYIYDFTMTNDFSGQDIYLRGGYYGGFFGSEQHSGSDPNGPAANFKSFRLALRYVGK